VLIDKEQMRIITMFKISINEIGKNREDGRLIYEKKGK